MEQVTKYVESCGIGTFCKAKPAQFCENTFKNLKLAPLEKDVFDNSLVLAKSIAKEFKKRFPKVRSMTRTYEKIVDVKAQNIKNKEQILDRLQMLKNAYEEKIDLARIKIFRQGKYASFDEFVDKLKRFVTVTNVADCGEHSIINQYAVLQKGERADSIAVGIIDLKTGKLSSNRHFNTHQFTVQNMSKNADINNPQTWGENAVVIDTWADGLVEKSDVAINKLKNFFKLNPNKENFVFWKYNFVDVDDYLKGIKSPIDLNEIIRKLDS